MTHLELISFAKNAIRATADGQTVSLPSFENEAPTWKGTFTKFQNFQKALVDGNDKAIVKAIKNKIFAREGNLKLPFLSFSSTPTVDCPGMGDCRNFCYSLKGWRNVHPFFRQLRNTLIQRFRFDIIETEMARLLSLKAYRNLDTIDFRLFVDGDFDSKLTLSNWMRLLALNTQLKSYGYSKSWEIFVSYDNDIRGEWPVNYTVNLSSGSKYSKHSGIANAMRRLPCVRGGGGEVAAIESGSFLAIGKKPKNAEYGSKRYRDAAKTAAKGLGLKRYFICPGQCGECTSKGHYCGSDNPAPAIILTH